MTTQGSFSAAATLARSRLRVKALAVEEHQTLQAHAALEALLHIMGDEAHAKAYVDGLSPLVRQLAQRKAIEVTLRRKRAGEAFGRFLLTGLGVVLAAHDDPELLRTAAQSTLAMFGEMMEATGERREPIEVLAQAATQVGAATLANAFTRRAKPEANKSKTE